MSCTSDTLEKGENNNLSNLVVHVKSSQDQLGFKDCLNSCSMFDVVILTKLFCDQQENLFHLQLLHQHQLQPQRLVQPQGPRPPSSVTMTLMCMPWQAWLPTSTSTPV